jgi:Bacterial SH3 domain
VTIIGKLITIAVILAGFYGLSGTFGNAHGADCNIEKPSQNKRYTTTDVNLRAYPSAYGEPLMMLPKGQIVFAFSTYQEWSRINVATMNIVGYVASRYLAEACVDGKELMRKDLPRGQIVKILMVQSQSRYSGSCPCPYYTDRAGRRCGRRSAYSRPGGASPLCYESDVSPAMIDAFLTER